MSEPATLADRGRPDPFTASSVKDYLRLLRRLRIWAGNPSLATLARRSGLPRTTIHDALSGKRVVLPSLELVRKLVEACGCSPAEMSDWTAAWRMISEERPTPASADEAMPPRLLPVQSYGFVGRDAEFGRLDAILWEWRRAEPATSAITVVCGPGGVGKTTLAVRWGHRVAPSFPDGQLYVNLNGFSTQPPMTVSSALTFLLSALGVSGERIPVGADAQAALFRTVISDRAILLVLDNAADVAQIRPLLPGTPTCFCLITSRHALGGLVVREGARKVSLDRLGPVEARDLLVACLGVERVSREEAAAAGLAALCANLPLALRIAAAHLADNPQWTIAEYAAFAAGDRLRVLAVDGDDEAAVAFAFHTSFAKLAPPAQLLFTRLGLLPGNDFTPEVAAVLTRAEPRTLAAGIAALTAGHLVEPVSGDRLGFHDLLRLFAARLADADAASPDVEERLAEWYLRSTLNAVELLRPDLLRLPAPVWRATGGASFSDVDGAGRWLDGERANLVALIERAAGQPRLRRFSWLLSDALRAYFHLRVPLADWVRAVGFGLRAAQADGDVRAEAAMRASLGDAAQAGDDFTVASREFLTALELCESIGDRLRAAALKTNLGSVSFEAGDLEQAGRWRVAAIEDYRSLGDRPREAAALARLATLYRDQGRLDDAAGCLRQAIEWHADSGDRYRLADATARLGIVLRHLGRFGEAQECAGSALEIFTAVGDRPGQACTLEDRAAALIGAGQRGPAARDAEAALAIARDLADRRIEAEALVTLGVALGSTGHVQRGLALARRGGHLRCQVSALIAMARLTGTRAYARDAIGIARRARLRLLQAQAEAVAETG